MVQDGSWPPASLALGTLIFLIFIDGAQLAGLHATYYVHTIAVVCLPFG